MAGAQLPGPGHIGSAVLVLLSGVLALAGCSASGSASSSQAPSTVSTTVTQTPVPPVGGSSSSAPSSTSAVASAASSSSVAAGSSACGNGQLKITLGRPNGASGHDGYRIFFRNVSGSTCTVRGYPGFDAFQGAKAPIHAKRTLLGFFGGSRHGLPTVHLAPGHTASATVEYSTVQTGNGGQGCPSTSRAKITVPNTTRAVTLPAPATLCNLQIHPTVPGTSGNYG